MIHHYAHRGRIKSILNLWLRILMGTATTDDLRSMQRLERERGSFKDSEPKMARVI
jgi:hypothetical protein